MKFLLKNILIMMIIIGLNGPSYSALSSDGSAFVTKAEFDSALADFNGRLTSFEAGINSKIDSQVTTYLDRNGIWSGKEQVRNEVQSKGTFKASEVGALPGAKSVKEWDMKEYVNEVSKSGLLVGKWYWKSNASTNSISTRWGWYGTKGDASYKPIDCGFLLSNVLFERKKNKTTDDLIYRSTFLIGNGKLPSNGGDGTSKYACFAPLTIAKMYYPIQLFVNKGSILKWRLECIYRFYDYATVETEDDDYSTIYVEWEKPKVY